MNKTITFIGAGNMARSLIAGITKETHNSILEYLTQILIN